MNFYGNAQRHMIYEKLIKNKFHELLTLLNILQIIHSHPNTENFEALKNFTEFVSEIIE